MKPNSLHKKLLLTLSIALLSPCLFNSQLKAEMSAQELDRISALSPAQKEQEAIQLFQSFLDNNNKNASLAWPNAVQKLIALLKDIPKYQALVATLREYAKPGNEWWKNRVAQASLLGNALKKHKSILPQELQDTLGHLTPNQLIGILRFRLGQNTN